MLDNLKKYNILLASKSPRRKEIMKMLSIPFTVITPGDSDESYPENMPKKDVPEFLALKKAAACKDKMDSTDLIITADTLVICDDRILGKPKNVSEAKEMLRMLSGKTHEVVTGVAVTTKELSSSFSSLSKVTFSRLTDEEIEYYVENYQPLDKAGAYGVQDWIGAVAVAEIQGSFYNVMGLPIHRLFKELKQF